MTSVSAGLRGVAIRIRNPMLYPAELRARPSISAVSGSFRRSPGQRETERGGNEWHIAAHWRHIGGHTASGIETRRAETGTGSVRSMKARPDAQTQGVNNER